ncbi:MAG: hypothetical protein FWD05_02575 [Oscillospiraceae bacterium]|nr:hypothetical protein [Oscillospiraceae bacterium]
MKKSNIVFFFLLFAVISSVACSSTTHEPETEFLLQDSNIQFEVDLVAFHGNIGRPLHFQILQDSLVWSMWKGIDDYSVRTFEFKDDISTPQTTNLVSAFESEYPIVGFDVSNDVITVLNKMESSLGISQASVFGEELLNIDLDFLGETGLSIVSVAVDSERRIYVAWQLRGERMQGGISVISGFGQTLFTISANYNITGIVLTSDDTPFALVDESTLKVVDVERESWGEAITLPASFQRIISSPDGSIHLDSSVALYEFNVDENTITRLFEYSQLGISWAIWIAPIRANTFFIAKDNGDVLYIRPHGFDSLILDEGNRTHHTASDYRNVLSFAHSSPIDPRVAQAVIDFNRDNENYRIEMRAINQADILTLRTELAIGRVPDIIMFGDSWCDLRVELPSYRLAARGLLVDLYTFLDNDPELSRQSFMPNLLYAISEGDSLYELPYRFTVDVAVGNASILGMEMGWTFDKMLATLDDLQFDGLILNPNLSQINVLNMMLRFMIDDFIDWSTGTAYFGTDEFQRLLEIVKTFARADIYGGVLDERELIAQGQQLMMWQTISRPNELQFFDFYFNEMVPVGFPVREGVGHSMRLDNGFAISSTTEHMEAAWSFVRDFYKPDFFESALYLIPMHIEAIESWFLIEDLGFTIGFDAYEIEIGPATDYDIERMRNILESVTRVSHLDRDICFIISEEVASYFNGTRNVYDTSRIIQNRVQTLVWEQG